MRIPSAIIRHGEFEHVNNLTSFMDIIVSYLFLWVICLTVAKGYCYVFVYKFKK